MSRKAVSLKQALASKGSISKKGSPGAPGAPAPGTPGAQGAKKELSEKARKIKEEKERKEKFKLQHNYPFKRDGKPMLAEGIKSLTSRNCIFISVDLEMFEFASDMVTEIGVATLELSPDGPMFPPVKAYHLMPTEHIRKINRKIMADKRHLFAHGETYCLSMAECRAFWQAVVDKHVAKGQRENKPVYLVGHEVQGDLTCLSVNGFKFDRTLTVLDTVLIWEATSSSSAGLGTLLKKLGIPAKFLHNAGNDAVATLQLLLALLDPSVRAKHKLDEGPSLAEANAAIRKANLEKKKEEEKLKAKAKAEAKAMANGETKGQNEPSPKEPSEEGEASPSETCLKTDAAQHTLHQNPTAPAPKLTAEAKRKLQIQRDRERTKKRLDEMQQDMPGNYNYVKLRELLDVLDKNCS